MTEAERIAAWRRAKLQGVRPTPAPRALEVAFTRLGSSGIVHTDYAGLGCGAFGPGDWTSGHRPEATCPACRENLRREGGMTDAMFYSPAAA